MFTKHLWIYKHLRAFTLNRFSIQNKSTRRYDYPVYSGSDVPGTENLLLLDYCPGTGGPDGREEEG
jgi:hypothetical protein